MSQAGSQGPTDDRRLCRSCHRCRSVLEAGESCSLPGEPHACALAAWRTVLLVDKVGALAGEAGPGFETKGLWIKYVPPGVDV